MRKSLINDPTQVRALRPLQQIIINIAGHEHPATDPLTDTARRILIATGTEWPTH